MVRKTQSGFSLVELSIVLGIIALLTAMILGGQSMLESAKVSNTIAVAKDLALAAKTFREKYKYWPGDYPNASTMIQNLPADCNMVTTTANIGNSAIDTATEIGCAIEQLFQAELVRAELDPLTSLHVIRTELGGVRLLSAAASNVTNFSVGVNVVEFANLKCARVQEIDLKIDDGLISSTSTGKAKASVNACTPGTTNDPVPFYAIAAN